MAPVRETCAQTLGVVLKYMNETGVHKTVAILLKLLAQEQWEVRHGGLLGIKYALAVRQVNGFNILQVDIAFLLFFGSCLHVVLSYMV